MTSISLSVLTLTLLTATVAIAADDKGHNGDEASTLTCKVVDTNGTELPAEQFSSSVTDDKTVLEGESAIFKYTVALSNAVGQLSLLDKRSGDRVTVREGDFDINEEVSVTLATDEAPDASLTLSCKATK